MSTPLLPSCFYVRELTCIGVLFHVHTKMTRHAEIRIALYSFICFVSFHPAWIIIHLVQRLVQRLKDFHPMANMACDSRRAPGAVCHPSRSVQLAWLAALSAAGHSAMASFSFWTFPAHSLSHSTHTNGHKGYRACCGFCRLLIQHRLGWFVCSWPAYEMNREAPEIGCRCWSNRQGSFEIDDFQTGRAKDLLPSLVKSCQNVWPNSLNAKHSGRPWWMAFFPLRQFFKLRVATLFFAPYAAGSHLGQ